jgi:hypothetical protein
MQNSDEPLVPVFSTDDPARVPLAQLTLDTEGIEYLVKEGPRGVDTMGWTIAQPATNRPRVVTLLVASDVAARARDLLADLEDAPGSNTAATDPVFEATTAASTSIQLEDASSGMAIGSITENELQELTTHLDEESPQQYFIDKDTIATFEHANVEPGLVELLRRTIGDGAGRTIRWIVR